MMKQQVAPEFQCSSLQGYVDASYADLVRVFGAPNAPTDGYKTDAEWRLMLDGTYCTIYNYKDGHNYLGAEGLPVEDIRDWHIGGNSKASERAVLAAIAKAEGRANVPYPQFCRHPDKCAGLGSCPRDPSCCD